MQKIFTDTRELDKAACQKYYLTDDILMENAASALEKEVYNALSNPTSTSYPTETDVLIITGSGDNGADGYALARKLSNLRCAVFCALPPKNENCIKQHQRTTSIFNAENSKGFFTQKLLSCKILVDCIFGSGFHGTPSTEIENLIQQINHLQAYKIACDVPSCLSTLKSSFKADITITMGALKTVLFTENAKDYVGKIICAPLGISSSIFQNLKKEPIAYLLEKKDLILPHRKHNNVNKGSFGHTVIIQGDKPGASIIAGSAAFSFGSGLVSIYNNNTTQNNNIITSTKHSQTILQMLQGIPPELMTTTQIPTNTTSILIGPGLGRTLLAQNTCNNIISYAKAHPQIPVVIDADAFYIPELADFLSYRSTNNQKTIITPHPKEFESLLKLTGIGEYSVSKINDNRLELSTLFSKKFPNIALILKGANPVISYTNQNKKTKLYINPHGKPCLAKGGSGDVLAGLVVALLAQGIDTEQAAIQSSLAHTLSSQLVKSDYSMTPFSLINNLQFLDDSTFINNQELSL